MKNPQIDPQSSDFGAVLNCAVRYAVGRRTYMPGIVIGFITPLLPCLNVKTLHCFDRDMTEQKHLGGYGDPLIDEPGWLRFHDAVRQELTSRGEELYKEPV